MPNTANLSIEMLLENDIRGVYREIGSSFSLMVNFPNRAEELKE